MRNRALLASLAFAAASTAAPSTADAAGLYVARYGSDLGNPMTGNAYAVHYNPAAIAAVPGTELTLDLTLANRVASYTRPASALSPSTSQDTSDPVYRDANTGRAKLDNTLVSPFFGAVTNFGTKTIAVGFASYVPFGGSAAWDRNDAYAGSRTAPGAVDGPQRWSAVSGTTYSWYNTLAASFTVPNTKLSFGLSGSYVRHTLDIVRARNIDGSDDMRDRSGQLVEGRTLLSASGGGFALGIGVYDEITPQLRVGASYLVRPGFGEMRLPGTLDVTVGNAKESFAPQKIEFLQTYPDIFRLGAAYKVGKSAEVRLDGDWTRWSAMKQQCVVSPGKSCEIRDDGTVTGSSTDVPLAIPRNWKDSYGARLSGSFYSDNGTEIFLGGSFETSAVPASTMDTVYMDAFKLAGAVGLSRWFGRVKLAASYNQSVHFTVDTAGKNTNAKLQNPSRSPSSAGRYEQSIIFLNANATVRF